MFKYSYVARISYKMGGGSQIYRFQTWDSRPVRRDYETLQFIDVDSTELLRKERGTPEITAQRVVTPAN